MVFDGSKESCPNYENETGLDMSYDEFIRAGETDDPQYGKEEFNKVCFNICSTKNEDGSDRGPTYIVEKQCSSCLDEEGDLNNPIEGTKRYLMNSGIYEMCNVSGDSDSGDRSAGPGLGNVWFQRQQGVNLSGSLDPDNLDLFEETTNEGDFSNLLSGLQYDSTFEACVNDKLNTGVDDFAVQERISKYTSIKEFTTKDIHYLKGKLRKIIVMKTSEVNECMNLLNLGKSICQTGVADKTLMIGSLIFNIVGNDKIDIMKADNDEKFKINKLVDELGPLIPQAVKNIIHISKEYESRVCNVPSNTTLLLERLYTDLYDKQTHITLDISPYIDFASLINMKDNVKFIKTIVVLVVFAFLFMHAANLAIAFLSRGSGKLE